MNEVGQLEAASMRGFFKPALDGDEVDDGEDEDGDEDDAGDDAPGAEGVEDKELEVVEVAGENAAGEGDGVSPEGEQVFPLRLRPQHEEPQDRDYKVHHKAEHRQWHAPHLCVLTGENDVAFGPEEADDVRRLVVDDSQIGGNGNACQAQDGNG